MSASRFSTGSIVKYSLLPRILPRFAELFLSGFHHIAFLMAQIYGAVRLLPANHPYLRGENIGKYSIRQVIAAAAGYLSFRRENIDQIIVFFVMLGGMILLLLQTLTVLGALMMPMSFAGPPPPAPPVTSPLSFGHYFGQPTYGGVGPSQDLAFILLDRVFGVPGIFNSCVDASLGVDCYGTLPSLRIDTANPIYRPATFPWPFHLGLHAMLEFYSMGLLVVACFIILYFVIVIVAETAQTGTPFGKRFNTVWAPLRLVMALGLLIPITSGLNSAQYVTLYMAKIGSNFASNGWIWYNSGIGSWGAAQALNLVAKPQTPEPDSLLQFMMLAHACKALEEGYLAQPKINTSGTPSSCTGIDPRDDGYTGGTVDNSENFIDGYLVRYDTTGTNDAIRMSVTDYAAARTFFEGGDIVVRFGDRGCDYTTQMGRVYPTCGEVIIPMVNPSNNPSEAGATSMQANYYETLRFLWGEYGSTQPMHYRSYQFCKKPDMDGYIFNTGTIGDQQLRQKAVAIVQHSICGEEGGVTPQLNLYGAAGTYVVPASYYEPLASEDWYAHAIQHYREGEGVPVAQAAGRGYPAAVFKNSSYPDSTAVSEFDNTSQVIAENIVRMGVIAQINAIVNTDEFEIVKNDPSVLIQMSQLSRGWAGAGMWYNNIARINGSVTAAAMNYPQATRMPFMMESVLTKVRQNNQNTTPQDQFNPNFGKKNAMVLKRGETETYAASILNTIYNNWLGNRNLYKPQTGNPMLDFINYIFGTKGLFNLDDPQNQVTNPLALLSSMGKAMVEASIRSLVGGTGAMAVSMAKFAGISDAADAISGILFSISTATLSAGITLYYVLPFMPFVYFFFAVGNWIKGIFEAMVGVPLWALAHIRIDGNGLPGEAAMNGYYMLFEIFLRPILILFGLIASVSIFGAMASVLNGIWPIASKNVGGANFDNSSTAGWVQAVRGPVDQLFFSVMYAVILYIMAMSSFKLIDLIPNQIMRWLGSGVSTFSDLTGDPGQSMMQYGGSIGNQISSQAVGGMQSLGQGGKALVQGTIGK